METRQDKLLAIYQQAEDEMKALDELGFDTDEAKEKLENIEFQICKEVSKMDYWNGALTHQINSLEELKLQFKEAIKAIDSKISKREATKKWIQENILPKLVNSKGKLDTGFKTYTLYESDGELKITDESKIPSEFIKTKIEQVVDKVPLKKYVKEHPDCGFASIEKIKKVRIS